MKHFHLILIIIAALCMQSETQKEIDMPYSKADFERVVDGKPTSLFTMKNENGMVVTLTNYGAKIVSIYVPDKNGDFADVMLGFNSLKNTWSGAPVMVRWWPFANRIANAQFTIGEETYQLPVNNGEACLHSGTRQLVSQGVGL